DAGDLNIAELRALADKVRDRLKSGIVFLSSSGKDKAGLMCTATHDVVERGFHCGNMLKKAAEAAGSSGGGRANSAQGGVKDPARALQALESAKTLIAQTLAGL
ncbi:MAG: alanine--tRNA ligase, partial [Eubacteriaceae bacterium]|nr:alanine--tRNA ligase [Eubacteriaceae bacterium]